MGGGLQEDAHHVAELLASLSACLCDVADDALGVVGGVYVLQGRGDRRFRGPHAAKLREKALLAADNGIHRRRRDVGLGRDVVDLRREIAALGEQVAAGVDDRLACHLRVLVAARCLSRPIGLRHAATLAQ